MPDPVEIETKALADAGQLLKFAAENGILSDNVVQTIALSWDANTQHRWGPDISAKFWEAYSLLSKAIKPVSLDTILCNSPSPAAASWQFWRSKTGTTKAKKTAERYLSIMIVFLLLSISLQFSVWTANSLLTEINKITDDLVPLCETVSKEAFKIQTEPRIDQVKDFAKLQNDIRTIWQREEQIGSKLRIVALLTGNFRYIWEPGSLRAIDSIGNYGDMMTGHYQNMQDFAEIEEKSLFAIKVANARLLPLFLGIRAL